MQASRGAQLWVEPEHVRQLARLRPGRSRCPRTPAGARRFWLAPARNVGRQAALACPAGGSPGSSGSQGDGGNGASSSNGSGGAAASGSGSEWDLDDVLPSTSAGSQACAGEGELQELSREQLRLDEQSHLLLQRFRQLEEQATNSYFEHWQQLFNQSRVLEEQQRQLDRRRLAEGGAVAAEEGAEEAEGEEGEEEYEYEDEYEYEPEYEYEETTISVKRMLDGCSTLAECRWRLRQRIVEFEGMEAEGWQLGEPIRDDYGTAYCTPPPPDESPEDGH